ncbi:MAG: hypothetical protein ACI9BD_000794, partial [Candidatus Marinamargulisbacteria bacterium]
MLLYSDLKKKISVSSQDSKAFRFAKESPLRNWVNRFFDRQNDHLSKTYTVAEISHVRIFFESSLTFLNRQTPLEWIGEALESVDPPKSLSEAEFATELQIFADTILT